MCQRPNGSLLRAWCLFLVLLLAALIGVKAWPEEGSSGSSQITPPASQTWNGKLAELKNAALSLKTESELLVQDSLKLLEQLKALQTAHADLSSSWAALLKLWTDSLDLRKAEKEAAEKERQALLDRALRAERNTRILGGGDDRRRRGRSVSGGILWAV